MRQGDVHVFVNRCVHRGVKFCRVPSGHVQRFTCPYHQWTYDLQGRLRGVPFHRGVKHQGGMPADFTREAYGLEALQVTVRHGAIFASFSAQVEPFADYLGPTMLTYFDRVFDGRALRLLGYTRQRIASNWKLMFENIKDPYHASLMHVFLVTFGLFRADQPSAVYMDDTGRHACLISRRGEQRATSDTTDIRNLREDFTITRSTPSGARARVPRRCDRRAADAVAESHHSAAIEHAGHAADCAARSWSLRVPVDIFRLRG